MPEISLFYGIRVTMYYEDHNPPHFHAEYNGLRSEQAFSTFSSQFSPVSHSSPQTCCRRREYTVLPVLLQLFFHLPTTTTDHPCA